MAAAAAVVIEMPAQDAALPNARILVNACTEGLREMGPCSLEDSTSSSARAVVIVSWEGPGHTAAKIEVGVRHGGRGADWIARHVTFNATDAEPERWRSVGLIIATLVEQAGNEKKSEPTPPSAAQTPAKPPPPPPTAAAPPSPRSEEPTTYERFAMPPAETNRWMLDAAFELARGASTGLGALGAVVRAAHPLESMPFLVTGSLRYESQAQASSSPPVSLQWAWATVGVSLATGLAAPVSFEGRLEPTLGWIIASPGGGGASKSGPLFGVREGVGATWWWAPWIGFAVNAEALETRSANVVVSPSELPVTTAEWLGWTLSMGLRFRPQ
jgi:hypothetical protein